MTERVAPVRRTFALKLIALLSIVRWYNILLTVFAQYLSAYVLLNHDHSDQGLRWMLTDLRLHAIVFASVFSIAGGFIINNFYDFEKDLINRPGTTLFNKWISRPSTLNYYIAFNAIAILVAFAASFRIGVFFTLFIISLWVYSHKLQRMPFIKELAAAILSITCFFAVLLHYSRFYPFIFVYGAFFMSLVYSRELVKQFINFNGDVALNIRSMPVTLGVDIARWFTFFIMVLSLLGGASILFYYKPEPRIYYIVLSVAVVTVCIFLLQKGRYKLVNTIYKGLIVLGVVNLFLM